MARQLYPNITLQCSGNAMIGNNRTTTGALIPSSSFLRNRLINGAMQIDQRNAGVADLIRCANSASYVVETCRYAD
jgi:hypothetical protein